MHTWRKNDDGELIHDGDCYFFVNEICTCGLLHHLMPLSSNEAIKLYGKKFQSHLGIHEKMLLIASESTNMY